MFMSKPASRFIYLSLILLLLFSLFIKIKSSEQTLTDSEGEELEDIEELIALDEEEATQVRSSEAELLSKAQSIVRELNNDNYKRVIDEHEYVMLLGYAPWCPRSAELMPQFAEAATSLKEMGSPLFMAKLDAERYPKAASALDIRGYPTLLLFVNGTSQAYTGGFLAEEIVIWTRKKSGVPVIRVSNTKEAEEFLKKHHMFVIGLFDKFKGQEYQEFYRASSLNNEIQFVETNDINVAKVLFPDIKPTERLLGIVKSEPERYTTFEGPFEADNMLQFLDYNKFPLVTKLTEINSAQVYSSPIKLQVLIFAKADDFEKLLEPLQDVARKFKSEIIFIYVDIKDENLARPFLTLYGLDESESTVVTAFDNEGSSKYLLESDITPKNMEEFCLGLLHRSLSPYFKSQPIPEKNESAMVQTVVGKTFDDLVLGNPKNVLLEVFTPWCINCETASKQVEKLAKHFKGLDDLVFARIDASANEHPKLQVDDFPTLLFYPASDKANPIKLSTKSSSKNLAEIINKQLKAKDQATKDEL